MRNSSLQYNKNNYYPFGLQHGSYNTPARDYRPIGDAREIETVDRNPYKYKYNSKEWQDELGLGWYDYGARNYDPALGRWINVDPLVEQTLDSYGYTYQNPINLVDPTGMAPEDWYRNGNKVRWFDSSASSVTDENGNTWSHFSDGYGNNQYPAEGGTITLGSGGANDWSYKSNTSIMFDAMGASFDDFQVDLNQIIPTNNISYHREAQMFDANKARMHEYRWSVSQGGLGYATSVGMSQGPILVAAEIAATKLGIAYYSWRASRLNVISPTGIGYTETLGIVGNIERAGVGGTATPFGSGAGYSGGQIMKINQPLYYGKGTNPVLRGGALGNSLRPAVYPTGNRITDFSISIGGSAAAVTTYTLKSQGKIK